MNDDLDIKQLLSDCRPEVTDSAEFMAALEKKLDAVEDIKSYHEEKIGKFRRITFIALLAGVIAGGLLVAFILLAPATFGQFHLLLDSSLYVFLMSYKTYFFVAFAILVMTVCLFPVLKTREA